MSNALIAACLWGLTASLIAMGPRRYHWPAAWALIAAGVPLLGWVTFENGPILGFLLLMGGISVLRWPVKYLLDALRGEGRRAN